MSDEEKKSCAMSSTQPLAGAVWFIGWWFTIGFTHLIWWKALIAIVLWPYYLGAALAIK